MNFQPRVSIVIPCFNEEKAIPIVMQKIQDFFGHKNEIEGVEVLVVNDGSNDSSAELLAKYQSWAKIIHLSSSRGYGGALKAGFKQALGKYILFMDMDDTYQIEDLQRLLEHLEAQKLSVVFGNRLAKKSGMPLVRKVGNRFYYYCLRLSFLPPLEDPCTGMRLFRRELVPEFCSILKNDLSYSMALTMKILTSDIKYGEIGISYEQRIGESKLHSLIDGWRFLWTILGCRLLA